MGLVSGVCFSETGVEVTCIDNNQEKIDKLNRGEIPIYEPTLDILMKRNFSEGRLRFTIDLRAGIENADIIFLALPTPESEDGSADLSYVLKMAETLSGIIASYKVIVNKSTVPVGTAAKVQAIFDEKCKVKVDVISNPEFLREGFAVEDFLKPDRIVIGSSSEAAIELMTKLYKPFVRQGNPIFIMDEKSAELTKYAGNAFLAMKISFMNEIALLAERVGADVESVRAGIGSDNRIGPEFLSAGIGFGGSCFPKDLKSLLSIGAKWSIPMHLVDATLKINSHQRHVLVEKAQTHFKGLSGLRCAVWGLSFKPETDDIRDSPALEVIGLLLDAGVEVSAFDPVVKQVSSLKSHSFDRCQLVDDAYSALKDADMLFLLTDWREFMSPDFRRMFEAMRQPVVFDGRNIWNPQALKSRGFTYYGIGRAT